MVGLSGRFACEDLDVLPRVGLGSVAQQPENLGSVVG